MKYSCKHLNSRRNETNFIQAALSTGEAGWLERAGIFNKIKKLFYIALMAIFVAGCANKERPEEAIRPVYFQKVDRNAGTEIRSFSGVAQPQNEAKLSFKVGGTIQQIAVQLGDTVIKGELIARLDATDYRINYNKAVASLKNAEVQLIAARSAFIRFENLYAGNNASLNDYEKTKAQYESAQAMAQTAREQVSAAQNQLDYTSLEAPYSGTVSAILAKENEMTGAGHPVVAFSSVQTFEVQMAVPENIVGRISQGMEVTVLFTTLPGKIFPGIITEVSSGSPGFAAYAVIVQLSGKPSAQLFAGMTGTVNVPLRENGREEASIIITPDAVSHDQNGDFVYLAVSTDGEGIYKAHRQNVTLGELSPAGYEIIAGLDTGDVVITAGIRFLYEGRKVKLLNNGKANDD
ncbi:MAG: efflux RND transporter periplasmic adaptor subunit [Clostridia bacterium]|nr:efflux RND transporter periplasmic adaptor subunit [Clostridia bacterium]